MTVAAPHHQRPATERLMADVEFLDTARAKAGTFQMAAYTGAIVRRWWGKAVFDLAGMTGPTKLAMLLEHYSGDVVGHADQVSISVAGGVQLAGLVYDDEEAGQKVRRRSLKGFPWKASIGVDVLRWQEVDEGQTAEVNGQTVEGPISIARESRLFESSFVVNPADKNTHAEAMSQEAPVPNPQTQTAASPAQAQAAPSVDQLAQASADGASKTREELGTFLAAFPAERKAWAADRFAAGDSLLQAKAALADVLQEELAAARQPSAPAAAASGSPSQAGEITEELAAAASNPGVGFNGAERQAGKPGGDQLAAHRNQSPEERAKALWDASEHLRKEFGGDEGAFKSDVRLSGIESYVLDEEKAFAPGK